MPPHGWRTNSTVPPPCPALAGTVASGQSPIQSSNAPISPEGGSASPEGGPTSLDAMGGGVHDGIGPFPPATVPARAGHGGGTMELARELRGASLEFYEGSPSRRESYCVDGIGLCPLVTAPARARHEELARERAGASSEFYEGFTTIPPCQALRARSREGKALFHRATPLFRRAPRRPWPLERPSHPPEASRRLGELS